MTRATYRQTGARLTEHELVREEGREGNEESSEPTPYVCELGCLARAGEGRIVCIPVKLVGRGRVAESVVREGVRVRALPVMSFLHERMSVMGARAKK